MPIAADVILEDGVTIFHRDLVNLYGCRVGAGTKIGTFVEIQKGAVIGRRCKISSHTFVCEGVTIEDEVFVGHGVMFINDRYPRATTNGEPQTEADWKVEPTLVRRGASIGSGAVLLCGVTIGEGALVGAGAVVTTDVPPGATVAGVPARLVRAQRRRRATGVIGIGVIGYGYWGPNLVRNFADCRGAAVRMVCDRERQRLEQVERRYPGVKITTTPAELVNDPSVDAVVIATPVKDHFDLAMLALRAGKHVLVEKPMTSTSDQAARLIDEAAARKKVLMVDHTFVYTGAVRKMRELTASGELGEIYYYDSVRINLGLFQHDVNVLVGPGRPRSVDHGLRADRAARGRLGDRARPRRREAAQHRLHVDVLRQQPDRPRARQLALAGEGAAHPAWRQPADGGVRRPGGEREDQGLRPGYLAEPQSGERLPDAGRLSDRRHVGAAAGRGRGAVGRGGTLRGLRGQPAPGPRPTAKRGCAWCGCSRRPANRWHGRDNSSAWRQ